MTRTLERTHPIEVGNIFVNSWGYDQTNVSAWQVIAVTPKTVTVQRIALEVVPGSDGFMSNRVRPVKDSFDEAGYHKGETLRNKKPYRLEWDGATVWYLRTDYGSCALWDGSRDYYCSWYA
jgi:hypothetical protein